MILAVQNAAIKQRIVRKGALASCSHALAETWRVEQRLLGGIHGNSSGRRYNAIGSVEVFHALRIAVRC